MNNEQDSRAPLTDSNSGFYLFITLVIVNLAMMGGIVYWAVAHSPAAISAAAARE